MQSFSCPSTNVGYPTGTDSPVALSPDLHDPLTPPTFTNLTQAAADARLICPTRLTGVDDISTFLAGLHNYSTEVLLFGDQRIS